VIGAALVLIVLGVILLFLFPWGGIVAGIVGVLLLIGALLGIGRRAAPPERS
jgi:NADH:ubiquinone oxidoreductase subunit 3 (subunit A)